MATAACAAPPSTGSRRDAQGVHIKVSSGQFLPAEDSDNARAFVVLGAKLKNELFGVAIRSVRA
jgi:hypothetical protein